VHEHRRDNQCLSLFRRDSADQSAQQGASSSPAAARALLGCECRCCGHASHWCACSGAQGNSGIVRTVCARERGGGCGYLLRRRHSVELQAGRMERRLAGPGGVSLTPASAGHQPHSAQPTEIHVKDGPHLLSRSQRKLLSSIVYCTSMYAAAVGRSHEFVSGPQPQLPRNCSQALPPLDYPHCPPSPKCRKAAGPAPSRCAQHVTGTRVIPGPGLALRTEGIVMRRLLVLAIRCSRAHLLSFAALHATQTTVPYFLDPPNPPFISFFIFYKLT
jgi:hypothetical protein